jgi:phosphoglycolate phosphatase-like HAD superfamily hydrolase
MIDSYPTTVFDLDGTLVRLNVDWDAVAEDAAAALRDHGVDPPDSLWEILVPGASVGVCSLNCEAACRIALSTHGIDGIDTVVGRDTVSTEKPDPRPLLETIDRLDGEPENAVFIGDSDRDGTTAERAGVDYVDVSAWLRAYR